MSTNELGTTSFRVIDKMVADGDEDGNIAVSVTLCDLDTAEVYAVCLMCKGSAPAMKMALAVRAFEHYLIKAAGGAGAADVTEVTPVQN